MNNNKIAFQGEHGAFSEQAAKCVFGKNVNTLPARSFDDVFELVKRGKVSAGIIPIENSLFGSIHQNYDLLQKYDLSIIGEIKLRVVHALMVNSGVRMKDVKVICSHPQALGQCEKFLSTLKGKEIVAVYDTAGAAKTIKEEKKMNAAAIASVEAASVYRLKILRTGIESNHQNFTRFLILSKQKAMAKKGGKTSIIFSMKNIPGSLFKALSVFSLRDIDLYKIESRPIIGKPWEYLFYLDFRGSVKEEKCHNAIHHLRETASYLKILGSYPEGKTIGGRRP